MVVTAMVMVLFVIYQERQLSLHRKQSCNVLTTVCFFSTATKYEDIAQLSDYAARWAIVHMKDN